MEFLSQVIDVFLHLDKYLTQIISEYGTWTYLILFLVIFVETGLVVMPFLPGDSLLFAAGALAANPANDLNVVLLMGLLFVAAFLGDTLNYTIGDYFGPKVFKRDYRFLKREYLLQTQAFYEKHGGKTIIFARFIPIIRTFAPFVAGVGTMKYSRFISYNIIGGFLWVVAFTIIGYFFGNLPFVKKNFTIVIFAIIFISILPPIIEFIKQKFSKKTVTK
ncbi:DedA family protein [Rhodocytophaga rosea]|uniref:DedA family protein n=1 Tax=Rhodocytophaga rosea TaxID=2704465 RepID=A0A6C0GJ58_9BACT|nr:DedA family protein [Rhodocytophaga rosea]QHT68101.1 DedA family protein [Rhodocytophaga rosea]